MALPPRSFVKKWVPAKRSSASRNSAAMNTGKMVMISTLAHRALQVKSGIFMRPMPGQRISTRVTMRLIAESMAPTPAISSAHT